MKMLCSTFLLAGLFQLAVLPAAAQNSAPAAAASPAELLISAEQAFSSGEFSAAAERYERAIALGLDNGYVEYNLGNIRAHNGDIGRAILHLRRAQEFLGPQPDIEANLKYVRNKVKDQLALGCRDGTVEIGSALPFFAASQNGRLWTAIICWLVFWTLIGLEPFRSSRSVRTAAGLSFCFTAAAAAFYFGAVSGSSGETCLRYSFGAEFHPAVIVAPEAEIRSSSAPSAQVVLVLHEGSELLAQQLNNGYSQVHLPGGRTGFVPQKLIENIQPPD